MEKYIRSKTSFMLGLASGIAIISTVGFLVFLGGYAKKEFGADKPADNEFADVVDNNDQPSEPTDEPADEPADTGKPVDVKVASTDHIRGDKNAPITIVEFSDIQCPFCSRFHDTMNEVMKNYPDKVRWVFKHFPLDSIHPYARKAAEATECAGEQNKFWEYTDKLYANQDKLNNEYFATAAKEVGLDSKKFDSCLSSGKMADKVDADFKYGQTLGVRGTPGSFINGKSIPGAVPFSQVESMIKAELQ